MKISFRLVVVIFILAGLLASCRTRRDCGGRKKRKIKTEMGGYM